MRILFTTIAGAGHFNPLVPIARAAADAGHTVAFACPASFAETVAQAGFAAFPAGFDMRGRRPNDLFAGRRKIPSDEVANWARAYMFIGVFAAAMTPDLLTLCRDWSPDVIVREASEYGACVAAEVLGIPHASVRSGAIGSAYTLRFRAAGPLATLRERHGLPPDPAVAMPFRYLHLAGEPADFLLPGDTPAPTRHTIRPLQYEPMSEGLPVWIAGLPDRPTIYATLGTQASQRPEAHALFSVMLGALRDEPVNLILTVGQTNDPAAFGPQPEHVRIERFIPQSALLPHCDLVVDQGGFSTVMGALAAGLPQVIIPLTADQPQNAACCATLGAAHVLGDQERTHTAIRAAVREVLSDPTYRRNAERVRDEMAALPGPEHGVELLERLARDKQPILEV